MTDTTELLKVLRKVQERCFLAEEENWAHDILSIIVPVLDEASATPQPTSTVEAGDALREAREALTHVREMLVAYGPRYTGKSVRIIDAALAKLDTAEKGGGGAMKRGFDSALPSMQPRNKP